MIEQIFIISLIVLFIHATTWKDMINEWVKKIIKPDTFFHKPIYGCPICMTPYWGTALYWIIYHNGIMDWLITVFSAAGISVLYVLLIDIKDYLKEIKEKYERTE